MLFLTLSLLVGQLNFEIYNPQGSIIDDGVFMDVMTHCTAQDRRSSYAANRTTHCHEAVHFLNNHLRTTTRRQCFYLGRHKYVSFATHPKVTLADVAMFVKPEDRNGTYQTYVIKQQPWWNQQPLYLLDEWSAYRIDIQCGKQESNALLSTDSWKSFHAFGDALLHAVQVKDPHYKELARLTQFVQFLRMP